MTQDRWTEARHRAGLDVLEKAGLHRPEFERDACGVGL